MQQLLALGSQPGDGTGTPGRPGGQIIQGNFNELYGNAFYFGVDSGIANAYNVATVLPTPAAFALTVGMVVRFIPLNANTNQSTLSVSGSLFFPIVNTAGNPLSGGELSPPSWVMVAFTGSAWQIVSLTNFSLIPAQVGGALYGLQTKAEAAASVTPANTTYPEGDWRRYGASLLAADNSAAGNQALLVSSVGGAAAFVPAGTWNITNPLTPLLNSSMYGMGNSSVIFCVNCNGLNFGANNNYTAGVARFFRDFQLQGNNLTTSTAIGININFTAASVNAVWGTNFSNIFISNFQTGVYLRQSRSNTWHAIFITNAYYGVYMIGQNTNNMFTSCSFQRVSTAGLETGSGGAFGLSIQSIAGESTQATQVIGCGFYGFDTNVYVGLAYELQIVACDIAAALTAGVYISTVSGGGVWVRDCFIQCLGGVANTIGVNLPAQAVNNLQDVHIVHNSIVCNTPFVASQGILIGSGRANVQVEGNNITGFDQGILGTPTGGAVIRHNTINVLTSVYSGASFAIQVNTLSQDVEVGPNTIAIGSTTALSPTAAWGQAATMVNTSANIGVTNSGAYPIGTPVQFDATQNGFTAGVTYFVLTSAANVITVGATAGGSAIAATGAVAVNVLATPLPLTFNTATVAAGTSFYGRGKFIGTLSDPAISGVISWAASGKTIALSLAGAMTGSAGSTSMTLAGVPAFLSPPTAQGVSCSVENNSVIASGGGYGVIAPGGTLTLYPTAAAGAWNNSGTKGLLPTPISWSYV